MLPWLLLPRGSRVSHPCRSELYPRPLLPRGKCLPHAVFIRLLPGWVWAGWVQGLPCRVFLWQCHRPCGALQQLGLSCGSLLPREHHHQQPVSLSTRWVTTCWCQCQEKYPLVKCSLTPCSKQHARCVKHNSLGGGGGTEGEEDVGKGIRGGWWVICSGKGASCLVHLVSFLFQGS